MINIPYLLALHSIDGLGPIRLGAILDYFKDPKLAWEANSEEIRAVGIPQSTVQRLVEARKSLNPQKYVEEIKRSGINWITIFDKDYPKLLAQIYDPPTVLYYKGDLESSSLKPIAVVGTRKITGYGRAATEQFTKGLVGAGMTIISGLARGVDSQAHLTTVLEKGKTIAVLGGGLNNIFPPENRGLAEKIASGFGAVISEFPPNYPSLPGNFPARNRIISGLSLAVLVIEAASDSGSLITAKLALEQGREVFAVPGPITSSLSKGPIDLIRQGAILFRKSVAALVISITVIAIKNSTRLGMGLLNTSCSISQLQCLQQVLKFPSLKAKQKSLEKEGLNSCQFHQYACFHYLNIPALFVLLLKDLFHFSLCTFHFALYLFPTLPILRLD
ncbi:DNA-processing protein DprA [Patescibacteria group bacterium]|nr:DNA-processing protein DprA [Patescibacteria group bacterium]